VQYGQVKLDALSFRLLWWAGFADCDGSNVLVFDQLRVFCVVIVVGGKAKPRAENWKTPEVSRVLL